ncbi:MAG: preprotein translocase subunit TatA [Gammaproteobacteria bacterium]|nr:preprotein translocase subunit TatA [Gammaproteobacteria bacterium]
MSLLTEKYIYPKLEREMISGVRHYTDGDTPVPSVTTILSETGDKTALFEWRKRVGDAEANRISRESAGLGTKVHNALENYCNGEVWDTFGNNMVSVMAKEMTTEMIDKGMSNVDEVWGIEVGLIAKGIYAGTADCVGLYNGVPSIIDFKTAKKIKKREWIEDYFLQGSAYVLAHNEMFESKIDQVAILMVDRDNKFKDFTISGDELTYYKGLWAKRVEDYYSRL